MSKQLYADATEGRAGPHQREDLLEVLEADLFMTARLLGDVLVEAGRIHDATVGDQSLARIQMPARRLIDRLRALCDELLGQRELLPEAREGIRRE